MIEKLSSKLANRLLVKSIINDTEKELYVYGFFILLSQMLYFILTVIFGILLDIVLQSVIFYVVFQFIRRYAGGIHASSELKCELATTLSIFFCLVIVKLCDLYNLKTIVLISTIVATVLIFLLCPLDTPEKPLTKEEYKYFRKISWIILLLIMLTMCIGWYFKLEFLMYPCCMSLILESILLVLGKTKKLVQSDGLTIKE